MADEEGRRDDGGELAEDLASRLNDHKKDVARLERVLKSLSGRWSDPKGVEKDLETLAEGEIELPAELAQGIQTLMELGHEWLEQEKEGRRGRLARELKEGARQREIPLSLVSREPLEIRLAPLGVQIDLEEAKATLTFGREELISCPADAGEIFTARDKALAGLDRKDWTPERFHRELREA